MPSWNVEVCVRAGRGVEKVKEIDYIKVPKALSEQWEALESFKRRMDLVLLEDYLKLLWRESF